MGSFHLVFERDIGGPMARTVTDVAYLLDVISGPDAADPVTHSSDGKIPVSYVDALTTDGLQGTPHRRASTIH